jgi:mRNA-degrading endonuclease toxin of MazEF toxin-antitoxin module
VTDQESGKRDTSVVDRGDVLWASDPFKSASSAERPLIVLNNETHPFDGEQWIAVAVSTTPRSRTLELTDDD